MPFDGQPSRGCRECRDRRVRCDQTVPACERCCRSNRLCSGYKSRIDLIFRDMNHVTETKVLGAKRSAGPGEPLPPETESLVQAAQKKLHDDIRFVYRPETCVVPCVNPGWEEMAVTRFFADYTISSDKFEDSLYFLPGLCRQLSDHNLLKESLHAVAFRSQGNQCDMAWLVTEGRRAYSRALLLLAGVSVGQAISDPVLAAVYLLGLYEVVSGEDDPSVLFPFNHYYGRLQLLKLRGDKQFSNPIQRSLFRVSLALTVLKSIIRHSEPPEEAEIWLDLSGMHNIGYRLAKLNIRLARLCAESQTLFDDKVRDEAWILGLMHVVKEAIILDLDYERWSECTYETWPYHKLRMCSTQSNASNSMPTSTPQTPSPHIYCDIWVAFVWNMYRGCRIHLHEVLLHSIDLLQSHPCGSSLPIDPELSRDQSNSIISGLISDICDSVPFCLSDLNSSSQAQLKAKQIPLAGYLLIWPLYVASVSVSQGSLCDLWIREKLRFISNIMGLHKAQLIARRPRKEPWDLT